jgi:hypothetical protein
MVMIRTLPCISLGGGAELPSYYRAHEGFQTLTSYERLSGSRFRRGM